MFAPSTHLTTRRPSPTTVLYTASTARPLKTLASRLLFLLTLLVRLVLGISVLLLALAKARQTIRKNDVYEWEDAVLATRAGGWAMRLASRLDARVVVPACLGVGYAVLRRGYTEESLLVLRGLGIQTASSSSTYLSTATTRFIPTTLIQDIFIHEAFRGFEVRFYLAVVVEGEAEVVVVFPVRVIFVLLSINFAPFPPRPPQRTPRPRPLLASDLAW
ncbi:MAG: hypothetical protein M1819_001515 [Sarea resinae]|nr:MAG: hypothetical protein M1819_001515 [Sarea resinae]